MSPVSLTELSAALAGHVCHVDGECDRATHAVLVAAPGSTGTVDVLDALARKANITLSVIEPAGCGVWLVRWGRVARWTPVQPEDDPEVCGRVLVRWLRDLGRDDEAVHAAHALGLLSDEAIELAWLTGRDALTMVAS